MQVMKKKRIKIVLYFSTNVGHEENEDRDSWDTQFLNHDVTCSCIQDYYDTEDGKNEGVVIYDKGSIESEYEEEDDQVLVLDKSWFV